MCRVVSAARYSFTSSSRVVPILPSIISPLFHVMVMAMVGDGYDTVSYSLPTMDLGLLKPLGYRPGFCVGGNEDDTSV